MTPAGPCLRPTFAELYAQGADYVFRTLRRMGVPEADCPDGTQEVFVVVHRRLSEYEPRERLFGWLAAIAANIAARRAPDPQGHGRHPAPPGAAGLQGRASPLRGARPPRDGRVEPAMTARPEDVAADDRPRCPKCGRTEASYSSNDAVVARALKRVQPALRESAVRVEEAEAHTRERERAAEVQRVAARAARLGGVDLNGVDLRIGTDANSQHLVLSVRSGSETVLRVCALYGQGLEVLEALVLLLPPLRAVIGRVVGLGRPFALEVHSPAPSEPPAEPREATAADVALTEIALRASGMEPGGVMKNMATTRLDRLTLVVLGPNEPTDEEWAAYLEQVERSGVARTQVLIWTNGGAPTWAQLRALDEIVAGRVVPTAVVSPTWWARWGVTALSCFRPRLRAFTPASPPIGLRDALAFLEIPARRGEVVERELGKLRLELDGGLS